MNLDRITHSGSSAQARRACHTTMADDFEAYLKENQDEIEALRIYFKQPHRRAEVSFKMLKGLLNKIKGERPNLMPSLSGKHIKDWTKLSLMTLYLN